MYGSRRFCRLAAGTLAWGLSASAFAGFPSTESFLPAVGRVAGKDGAQFYTTIWATNLTGAPVHFTFDFLKSGQANPNPAKFTDTLAPGETKVYENVVESKLGLTDALGAARVTSDGEILVAERIYNQAPGADLGDTEGLFFAAVPKSFSISAGQSASIQGVDQGGSEDFRYNFALVETAGGSATVNVQVFDGAGTLLGQKAFPLSPYEQIQPGVGDVVAGIHTTNARITATVTGGTGSVLLAGAQVANVSQDSSGFEMSFRDDILGSGTGTPGVTALNGLTGAVSLAAGSNVTLNKSGQTITIAATGGGSGSGGLNAVAHDSTLQGDGTGATPLGVTLPAIWTADTSAILLQVINTGGNYGIYGVSAGSYGVYGQGGLAGIFGASAATGVVGAGADGVLGESEAGGFNAGVRGDNFSSGVGVYGDTKNANAFAVYGNSHGSGFAGYFDGDVHVQGTLSKAGGSFKIDHPLDPAHKYLSHSFVESPDMKNIYDGLVAMDASGTATVTLPEWFGALNRDFRYQLTALGTPQPGLYVADEIHENAFRIAGGVPGARVSWMVTGIRHDAWADAHRIPVEEVKPEPEQGTYLEPALFGEPDEKSARSAKERQRGQKAPSQPDEMN